MPKELSKNIYNQSLHHEKKICYDGQPLVTRTGGAVNSSGGFVLSAYLPDGRAIIHRSFGDRGRKGWYMYKGRYNFDELYVPSDIRNHLSLTD